MTDPGQYLVIVNGIQVCTIPSAGCLVGAQTCEEAAKLIIDGSFNEPCGCGVGSSGTYPDLPHAHVVGANVSASGMINLSGGA